MQELTLKLVRCSQVHKSNRSDKMHTRCTHTHTYVHTLSHTHILNVYFVSHTQLKCIFSLSHTHRLNVYFDTEV